MTNLTQDNTQIIIDEYDENYCLGLEHAYGDGMMSDGGHEATDRLFTEDNLDGKTILEIGFGLGGSALHIASTHNIKELHGLEINPWMVKKVSDRFPESVKDKIKLHLYHPQEKLNFDNESFDLVFSKGVLTHLKDKQNLFNELYRILKPGGVVIINDCLSPNKGKWCDNIQRMTELDNLTMYAETETGYDRFLSEAGFTDVKFRDENPDSYKANMNVVENLERKFAKNNTNQIFNKKYYEDSIEGYKCIANDIKDNELLMRWIRCVKK